MSLLLCFKKIPDLYLRDLSAVRLTKNLHRTFFCTTECERFLVIPFPCKCFIQKLLLAVCHISTKGLTKQVSVSGDVKSTGSKNKEELYTKENHTLRQTYYMTAVEKHMILCLQ